MIKGAKQQSKRSVNQIDADEETRKSRQVIVSSAVTQNKQLFLNYSKKKTTQLKYIHLKDKNQHKRQNNI